LTTSSSQPGEEGKEKEREERATISEERRGGLWRKGSGQACASIFNPIRKKKRGGAIRSTTVRGERKVIGVARSLRGKRGSAPILTLSREERKKKKPLQFKVHCGSEWGKKREKGRRQAF